METEEIIAKRRAACRKSYWKLRERRLNQVKNFYLKNREEILKRNRTPEHREKLRKWMNAYYYKNKEKLRSQELARRALGNRDERLKRNRSWSKQYYHLNIARSRLQKRFATQVRRARLKKVKNDFTIEQWDELKKIFNYRCAYCNRKKKLTIDHVIAIAKGGDHTASNIVPACNDCNMSKFTNRFPHNSTSLQLHLIC